MLKNVDPRSGPNLKDHGYFRELLSQSLNLTHESIHDLWSRPLFLEHNTPNISLKWTIARDVDVELFIS